MSDHATHDTATHKTDGTDLRGEQLAQAAALASRVLSTTDIASYGDPTPCTEHDVADLVNHLVFGFELATTSANRVSWGEELTADTVAPSLRNQPQEDWARLGVEESKKAGRAWLDPATWDGETTMGSTPMPAAMVGGMMVSEFVVHGWDLATATGQDFGCPEALAATAVSATGGIAQMGRDGGWYGPEVQVGEDASTFERLLAMTGRDPSWRRPPG